jgi:hypothetical protein
MKQWLKKWWKKSQTRAIGFEFTTRGGTHVSVYWTWLGVFIWGSVITWLILK